MTPGYVYVITNPCIQYAYMEGGVKKVISPVKIGMAKDVEKRLGTLNTSLPENFVHHMSVFANDPKAVENVVHDKLEDYRIFTQGNERTEFFRCTVEMAVNTLKRTAKIMHLKEYHIKKTKIVRRSSSKPKKASSVTRRNQSTGGNWSGKTQLAKLIARRGGNEGAFGGVLQYFAPVGSKVRRPCHQDSKWRSLLDDAGVKFDQNDFVIDWSCAQNPL